MTRKRVEFVSLTHELSAWNDAEIDRGPDLLVALTLATFADRRTGAASVSLPTLADRSRQDVKTVRASIERLARSGRIYVENRPGRPSRITLALSTPPTDSGGTEFGTPTDSGSTRSGTDPHRMREGTLTESGSRTKGSSTKRGGTPLPMTATTPVETAVGPSPIVCLRHPNGTDEPCHQCRAVRLAAEGAASSPRPVLLVDGCAYVAHRGRHFMIAGDRFCNSCGLDPETGDRRDLKSGAVTLAEQASA